MKKKRGNRGLYLVLLILFLGAIFFGIGGLCLLSGVSSSGGFGSRVAVIPVVGVITRDGGPSGYLSGGSVSSREIVQFLKEVKEDNSITAVVLDINSPGGSAVASEEIADAIKKIDKPTVAIIREAGASGGYWIASATDHIIASKLSITGSIGVLSSYIELSKLFEAHGITYQRMVGGTYKDIGSMYKELTEMERNILQKKIDEMHRIFMQNVADNREMKMSEIEPLATGEFFTGEEALRYNLIDEIGSDDAVEIYLKKELNVKDISYQVLRRKVGLFEVSSSTISDVFYKLGLGIGNGLLKKEPNNQLMMLME